MKAAQRGYPGTPHSRGIPYMALNPGFCIYVDLDVDVTLKTPNLYISTNVSSPRTTTPAQAYAGSAIPYGREIGHAAGRHNTPAETSDQGEESSYGKNLTRVARGSDYGGNLIMAAKESDCDKESDQNKSPVIYNKNHRISAKKNLIRVKKPLIRVKKDNGVISEIKRYIWKSMGILRKSKGICIQKSIFANSIFRTLQ